MIIGWLLFADLVIEFTYLDEFRLISKLTAIASFLVMVWRDVEITRKAFWLIYSVNKTI